MTCREALQFVNKIATEQNYVHSISVISKIYINMCTADLYINTAVSFKSNITKIYYCWPPIFSFLLFQKTICISDILRILVCDMAAMARTLIPFAVRENLRSQS